MTATRAGGGEALVGRSQSAPGAPSPRQRGLARLRYGWGRALLLGRALSRQRVAAPLWWLARAASGRGSQARRRQHQEQVVAQALASAPGELQGPWQRIRVVSSGSALIVADAESTAGHKVVVKLAGGAKAAHELRLDAAVRGRLAAEGRLGGWSALLPEVVGCRLDDQPAVIVERRRGDCDGRHLLSGPLLGATVALRAALDAVAELHESTQERAVAGEDLLRQWVHEPLAVIASLYDAWSWQARCLARLEVTLADGLSGRDVATGWAHGDYTPGNLLFSRDGHLQGIIDWGAGSHSGLLGLDTSLLALTTVMLRHRLDLGHVMVDLMGHPRDLPAWEGQRGAPERWHALERLALGRSREPTTTTMVTSAPPGGNLEPLTTLWLTWAQHIARNIAKAEMYSRRPAWRMANVDVVLALAPRTKERAFRGLVPE